MAHKKHQHRSSTKTTRTVGYTGPVTTTNQNPAAHGNVTEIAKCRCGATRRINRNQQHVERGPWVEARD